MSALTNVYFSVDKKTADLISAKLFNLLSAPMLSVFLKTTVDPYLRQRVQDRFRQEGDDASGPWVPLADSTHFWREEQGFPPEHPINIRTGQMFNWATSAGSTRMIGPSSSLLTFPGRKPSGAKMERKVMTAQRGIKGQRRGAMAGSSGGTGGKIIPARPILAVDESDMLWVMSALSMQIRSVL